MLGKCSITELHPQPQVKIQSKIHLLDQEKKQNPFHSPNGIFFFFFLPLGKGKCNILYTWSKLRSSSPRNFPELYHDSWRQPDPGQVKIVPNGRHEDIRRVSELSVFLYGQRQWRGAWGEGRGDDTIGLHLPLAPRKTRKRLFTLSDQDCQKATCCLQIYQTYKGSDVLRYLFIKPSPEAKEK